MVERRGSEPHLLAGARTPVPSRRGAVPALRSRHAGAYGHLRRQFGIAARIKWTNDIYAGDKKLVGILIEHSYSGQTLARTIVGIGINVNQTEFVPALPNPVSMAMVAGRTFDRGEVLEAFRRHIGIRYAQLELDERETLQRDYRERMYRLGERHTFRYPDGTPTEASIEGVRPTGELLLRHADGTLREYLFKEIEFVIAGK